LREFEQRHHVREDVIKCMFVLWLRDTLKPRDSRHTSVKPASCLAYVYAVHRVHKAHGLDFFTASIAKRVFQHLLHQYVIENGIESLLPHKKEGISRVLLRRLIGQLLSKESSSQLINKIQRDPWLLANVNAALCLCGAAGLRVGEVSIAHGSVFNALSASRANVFFKHSSLLRRNPPVSILRSLRGGNDQVGFTTSGAKNDTHGQFFGSHPVMFNIHDGDPACAGLALINLAIQCPLPDSKLSSSPLFTSSADGTPIRPEFLQRLLKELIVNELGHKEAEKYAWHSFRIGLACCLKAAGAPDSAILALCRWRSLKSLPGYGRLNFDVDAGWRDKAALHVINSCTTTNLPPLRGPTPAPIELFEGSCATEFLNNESRIFENSIRLAEVLPDNVFRAQHAFIPDVNDFNFFQDLGATDF